MDIHPIIFFAIGGLIVSAASSFLILSVSGIIVLIGIALLGILLSFLRSKYFLLLVVFNPLFYIPTYNAYSARRDVAKGEIYASICNELDQSLLRKINSDILLNNTNSDCDFSTEHFLTNSTYLYFVQVFSR